MTTELDIRKAICETGRRMYAKNLVAATDGNISVRLAPNRFVCTPSGVSKGFLTPNDLLIADGKGNKVSGQGKVTSEFFTHLAAYEERPEMKAVVHAHPPKAIGLTLAGISLAECVLPEVVYTVGGVPTSVYATPATKEGAAAIRELIRQCDAILLDRHGALTIGVDVYDAYFKMEKIEHAAETLLVAHLLGRVPKLPPEEVEKLYDVRRQYGVSGRAFPCVHCDGSGADSPVCRHELPSAGAEGAMSLDNVILDTLKVLGHG
ncbi:MAG: class II aldolase/adducin family protein [Candidatus Hydrogenedentes bacterium]|nr:class II aldolase/adducin family protein [Candidatus Hydrogenedentota bacterium]